MMFKDGEHNLIALTQDHAAVGLCDKIDGVSRISGENDLIFGRRVQKLPHGLAGVFKSLRCSI